MKRNNIRKLIVLMMTFAVLMSQIPPHVYAAAVPEDAARAAECISQSGRDITAGASLAAAAAAIEYPATVTQRSPVYSAAGGAARTVGEAGSGASDQEDDGSTDQSIVGSARSGEDTGDGTSASDQEASGLAGQAADGAADQAGGSGEGSGSAADQAACGSAADQPTDAAGDQAGGLGEGSGGASDQAADGAEGQSSEGAAEEPSALEQNPAAAGQAGSEESGPASGGQDAVPEEQDAEDDEKDEDGKPFRADRSDLLAYDPLYIMEYADRSLVDVSEIDMGRFLNVVTAAKGIATYNIEKQAEFDVTETNYLAGMTYEMPVYNIDDSSDYYIAIPGVNTFNSGFREYDLTLAYNNDYAETIGGYRYKNGILYIPKTAVDHPSNRYETPAGSLIAVQVNYAIGGGMDFSKTIPVQVLTGDEPVNRTARADNLFDMDSLSVDTGVRGRSADDILVFLNGHIIPINTGAWSYNKETGSLRIYECPGVVSCVNILFKTRTILEAARDTVTSAVESAVPGAYAATSLSDMSMLKEGGSAVKLDLPLERMFVGWRGYYSADVVHGNSSAKVTKMKKLAGYTNSVSYLYGGYANMSGDGSSYSDAKLDKKLAPTWAVSSYAVGYDLGASTNYGKLTVDEQIKHYNRITGDQEKHTIYEWMKLYRNTLDKSLKTYGGGKANGLGGTNNFAFSFPKKIYGATGALVSEGDNRKRANKTVAVSSKQIEKAQGKNSKSAYYDYYLAAGCNHLDMAAGADGSGKVYVTCLALNRTDNYIVLAFVQSHKNSSFTQNACGIYKFKIDSKPGRLQVKKQFESSKDAAKYGAEVNGARYRVYTNKKCTTRARDTGNTAITLTVKADGTSNIAEVLADKTYYIKEYQAPDGCELDKTVYAAEPGSGELVIVTSKEKVIPGGLRVVKKEDPSDTFEFSELEAYRFKDAHYVLYTDRDCTRQARNTAGDMVEFVTDESGASQIERVKPGTYYLRETKPPVGFAYESGNTADGCFDVQVDPANAGLGTVTVHTITVPDDETKLITVKSYDRAVYSSFDFRLRKNAAGEAWDKLIGTEYAVRYYDLPVNAAKEDVDEADAEREWIFTTTADMFQSSDGTAGMEAMFDFQKAEPLDGSDEFYTDSDGKRIMPRGIFTIEEVTAPAGFDLDPNTYMGKVYQDKRGEPAKVSIEGGKQLVVDMSTLGICATNIDTSKTDGFDVFLSKLDIETEGSSPISAASLKGAVFEVSYYKNVTGDVSGTSERTWRFKTDENGSVRIDADKIGEYYAGGDILYQDDAGNYIFPAGTYRIIEKTAPEGYLLSTEEKVLVLGDDADETPASDHWGETDVDDRIFYDQVKRSELKLQKKDENGKKLTNLPFIITNLDTGETQFALTDQNGIIDTANIPKTRSYDAYRAVLSGYSANDIIPDSVIEELVSQHGYAGIWFGMTGDGRGAAEPDDSLGALPYGHYNIRELVCDKNRSRKLVDENFDIIENGQIVDLGTIIEPVIRIRTRVRDRDSNNRTGTVAEKVQLIDTVQYWSLETDRQYRLRAELHWAAGTLGNETDGGIVKDAEGREIRGESSVFTPGQPNDSVDVTFAEFDSTRLSAGDRMLEGERTVVYEYLYEIRDGREVLITQHTDPGDDDQIISYPWISTLLTDSDTGLRMGAAREKMRLTDKITYKNFRINQEYHVEGCLYDADTGLALKDAEGHEIKTDEWYTAGSRDGSFSITYEFDSRGMEGRTIVSLVTLSGSGASAIRHADKKDELQTVHIPRIRTRASDKETGDDVGRISGTFTDIVTYENLLPGLEYRMVMDLMDRSLEKSAGIQAETIFRTDDSGSRADGEVTIECDLSREYSGDRLENMSLVAFEECYVRAGQVHTDGSLKPDKDALAGEHKDMDDSGQTVHYPRIRTVAADMNTADHVGSAAEEDRITDTVELHNLVPGRDYTIKGTYYDTDTESIMAAAEKTFRAASDHEFHEIVFDLNSLGIEGHTGVIYEKLFHNNIEITQHEEWGEELQRIHYPRIMTTAADDLTGDHAGTVIGRLVRAFRRAAGQETEEDCAHITDTVKYWNLLPDMEYTVSGVLMNKETGEVITDESGEPVSADGVLPADEHGSDGETELTFNVDTSKLQNVTVVVFERLYHRNAETGEMIPVTSHEDINDEEQSVHEADIRTHAEDTHIGSHGGKHTGDASGITLIRDHVTLNNLVNGLTYTLKGTLYDKATGRPLKNADGMPYSVIKTFTLKRDSEERRVDADIYMEFEVDGSLLAGRTAVAFEELYHNDVMIAVHADIDDEEQSVHYPEISTRARLKGRKVRDRISYKNLVEGNKYVIRGYLVRTSDGRKLKGSEGETYFTPKKADGYADVLLPVNGYSGIRGTELTAFEELYIIVDGNEIRAGDAGTAGAAARESDDAEAVHSDGVSEAYVKAAANAADGAEEGEAAAAGNETAEEILAAGAGEDAIENTGAEAGEAAVSSDGLYLIDGSAAEETFRAAVMSGSDGSVLITVHKDRQNRKQTVKIPEKRAGRRTPKTGDNWFLYIAAGVFMIALIILLILRKNRPRY